MKTKKQINKVTNKNKKIVVTEQLLFEDLRKSGGHSGKSEIYVKLRKRHLDKPAMLRFLKQTFYDMYLYAKDYFEPEYFPECVNPDWEERRESLINAWMFIVAMTDDYGVEQRDLRKWDIINMPAWYLSLFCDILGVRFEFDDTRIIVDAYHNPVIWKKLTCSIHRLIFFDDPKFKTESRVKKNWMYEDIVSKLGYIARTYIMKKSRDASYYEPFISLNLCAKDDQNEKILKCIQNRLWDLVKIDIPQEA